MKVSNKPLNLGVNGRIINPRGLSRAYEEIQGRRPTPRELDAIREAMARADVRAEIPRNYVIMLMLEMAGEQSLIVYGKRLCVLESPSGHHFVTADAPMALVRADHVHLEGISLMMADEAFLSIDRRHCLLLKHPVSEDERGLETIEEVNADRVDEINGHVVGQAHRFVFCHPDDVGHVKQ